MNRNDQTTLVTGGAGYIGSHVVLALRDAGIPVVVLDDLSTGSKDCVPTDVPFVTGPAENMGLVRQILLRHSVSSVMHLAASVSVPESVSDPLKYYRNNTCTSRNLIDVCVDVGVRYFVFCSTAAVYGAPKDIPVTETAATAPISPYGVSKLLTEWMLRDTALAHNFRYVALRPFNVAGADPQGRSGQSSAVATHLIEVACQAALGLRERMDVFGGDYDTADGTCIRDFVHVSDVAEAHLLALRYLEGSGDSTIINLGGQSGFSVRQVVDIARQLSGRSFSVVPGPRRSGDPACLVASARRARDLLGWRPKRADLAIQIGDALRWHGRNAAAARMPDR